jgi:hypothetical protein
MTALLIGDAEIAAGFAPFNSVWWDPPSPSAELSQQMRQLMPKGAVDLTGVMLSEARIQGDYFAARVRPPGGAEKTGIPFYAQVAREFLRLKLAQYFPRFRFQGKIAAQDHE